MGRGQYDRTAAKAARELASGTEAPDVARIVELGGIVPLRDTQLIQKVEFHVGVQIGATVKGGFDVDHQKKIHNLDISGEVCDVGILIHLGEKTKIVPWSNIKEVDLK